MEAQTKQNRLLPSHPHLREQEKDSISYVSCTHPLPRGSWGTFSIPYDHLPIHTRGQLALPLAVYSLRGRNQILRLRVWDTFPPVCLEP